VPALARRARENARWIACIAPPHLPYAPAWQAAGIDLARLLLVRPNSAAEALWATRQALASSACSAVLAWLTVPDHQSLRRLQLAAEAGGGLAFLFRPACAARDFSPAPLRLQLSPAGPRLAVHLLKRRGPRAARPLLIDLARAHAEHAVARPLSAEPAAAGLSACRP
jgi:cell division inhibitor SulA/protein ImuA